MARLHQVKSGVTVLLLLTTTVIVQSTTNESVHNNNNSKNNTDVEKLVFANTEFALALLKQLASETTGNVFMSPASISIAMAMTYLGTRGESAAELGKVLGFDQLSQNDLHQSFSQLRKVWHDANGKYLLITANRLFGDKSYKFMDGFLADTESYYGARLAAVDFRNNPEEARLSINKWVEERTYKKIPDLLQPGSLNQLTKLILVNAIYFKSIWAKKFDPGDTRKQDFYVSKNEKFPVSMMQMFHAFNYGAIDDASIQCQVVELQYLSKIISMFVFLPSEELGADGLISELKPESLSDVENVFNMSKQYGFVALPTFKLEESFSLKETFEALGLNLIFSEEADFSGIGRKKDLQVSNIIHKAFISVHERGTEAGAASAVDVILLGDPEVQFELKANRPFIFMIRDNVSRTVLFLGKVSNPKTGTEHQKDEL